MLKFKNKDLDDSDDDYSPFESKEAVLLYILMNNPLPVVSY